MVELYSVMMRAPLILKLNIQDMLRARHLTQADLEQFCFKKEGWLSHLLRDPNRGLPIKHLDRIADFFGVAAYQLFQPGLVRRSERRRGVDRRSGIERRISHQQRLMNEVAATIDRSRPHKSDVGHPVSTAAAEDASLRARIDALARDINDLVAAVAPAETPGGQTPVARRRITKTRTATGTDRGSSHPKAGHDK